MTGIRLEYACYYLQHAAESKHHGPVLGADVEVCEGGLGLVAPCRLEVGVGGRAFPCCAEMPWAGCPPGPGPRLPSLSSKLSRRVQKYASRLDK